jgi:transposase-like protein
MKISNLLNFSRRLPGSRSRALRIYGWMLRLYPEAHRRAFVPIFPNRESALRLLGAVLMEHAEQWSTSKRYFDMSAYWQWRAVPAAAQPGGGLPRTAYS